MERGGLYPLAEVGRSWGPVWFVASLALMIVGQDAWIYWTHRWMHRPRVFRTFHRRHHRSHNPSPFTAYSFDLGEALLMVGFVAVWPLIVPTPWPVIGLFMLHQIFRNTMLHAGYELWPARADGRPWFDWITTTTHHDLHHAQAGWNYAPWFTWWDRWMGTEHPRVPRPLRRDRASPLSEAARGRRACRRRKSRGNFAGHAGGFFGRPPRCRHSSGICPGRQNGAAPEA